MVVMNEYSQAGSAYKDQRIEFIINRRVPLDDMLGIAEPLNETDNETGFGLNV